ncbi:hypothetical protein M440DRAFT_1425949 [Trichoderma longibrachiatum ATCC 18648]|uniref:Uncharacterized protein n=1 Tax=Trichoderma longibrachiatum ATCC 18648 TaxID=983965 RepID=A0A2T4BS30_TRILO|nr:hypothetical protein M440DRAFT_1425949 [Trichoderma longibrachiatum ATCC 18648]
MLGWACDVVVVELATLGQAAAKDSSCSRHGGRFEARVGNTPSQVSDKKILSIAITPSDFPNTQDNTRDANMVRLYGDAVIELTASRIQPNDFYKQCLSHFGPVEQRAHHGPNDSPLNDSIGPLMWGG